MDHVSASGDNITNFFTQTGEIGRQYTGSNAESSHDGIKLEKDMLFYPVMGKRLRSSSGTMTSFTIEREIWQRMK
jgi:hypothetical protein